jgi:hypothetical protein
MATDLHTLLRTKKVDNQFTQYFLYQIMVSTDAHISPEPFLTLHPARSQIHPFSRCRPPRPQTEQHPNQRELRSQNLRLRSSPRQGIPNDRLRFHKILPGTRDHAHLATIYRKGRYLECGLYLCRNDTGTTALPGQKSRRSVLRDYSITRKSACKCDRQCDQCKCLSESHMCLFG